MRSLFLKRCSEAGCSVSGSTSTHSWSYWAEQQQKPQPSPTAANHPLLACFSMWKQERSNQPSNHGANASSWLTQPQTPRSVILQLPNTEVVFRLQVAQDAIFYHASLREPNVKAAPGSRWSTNSSERPPKEPPGAQENVIGCTCFTSSKTRTPCTELQRHSFFNKAICTHELLCILYVVAS